MAYRIEKDTGDIVIDGWETGIAPSPHKGIANIQNANISTETNEVVASFVRSQQTLTNTSATGSLTYLSTDHVNLTTASTNNLYKGNWITVTGSSNTGQLPNATYYVPPSTGAGFKLSTAYIAASYTPPTVNVSALVMGGAGGAGAGSAGAGAAGGGGGGGVTTGTAAVGINTYAVTVGTVGAIGTGPGTSASQGTNGVDSTFSTLTGVGGGGGGGSATGFVNGRSGGSGGGGGGLVNSTSGTGGAPTAGQGNTGGSGTGGLNPNNGGGGGGGAGGVGGNAAANTAGIAGVGVSNSISGSPVVYGAGGNGGAGGQSGNPGNPLTSGAGIVVISYTTGSLTATGGVITTSGGNTIHTFATSGSFQVTAIPQVTVAPFLTGFTAGLTASFTMVATLGNPIAQATETYYASGIPYHRYYVLDNHNLVWVYDEQNEVTYSSTDGVSWFLPDISTTWCTHASGIGVISGFLIGATEHGLFGKPVSMLGNTNSQTTTWVQFPDFTGWKGALRSTTATHFCYVGHQGVMYITDNSYLVSVFPDSTIVNTAASSTNIQSLCSWTANDANNMATTIISGTSLVPSDTGRVPVVFFTPNTGVLPTAITANTVYYLQSGVDGVSQAYAAATGGSSLDIQTGASGTQYVNTFYPLTSVTSSTGANSTWVLGSPRLSLPGFEIATCMAEIGNIIIIGCKSNVVYPWNQVDNLPTTLIPLPEGNVVNIVTVNSMAYLFAGNNGNVYITDGNTSSLVVNIPDYCAGVPGSAGTYVESTYYWGGAMYLRGRVYFSVLDQSATKAGNCGGVWSFVPTQNLYIGQDTGLALRLEAQNSYATYNGTAPLLITKQVQDQEAPLYWSAWYSSVSSPAYGIDYSTTGTSALSPAIIETDAIPVGTMLTKKTFSQIEYKLGAPLDAGATVTGQYRVNITDAWAACNTFQVETNALSGYAMVNFQQDQWLQFRFTLTPITSSAATNSFIRFREVRLR